MTIIKNVERDLSYTEQSQSTEPAARDQREVGISSPEDGETAQQPAAPTLPRHIPGGFLGVVEDLDRQSRDWSMMVRLLEQQRLHLETAEQERTRLFGKLEAVVPTVVETGRLLDHTIETTKSGDVSANLSALFTNNLRALDELENTAKALTANLLWTRSSWEQYARSVIGAQKMRDTIGS